MLLIDDKFVITERQMVELALLIDKYAGEDTTNDLLADWLINNLIHTI